MEVLKLMDTELMFLQMEDQTGRFEEDFLVLRRIPISFFLLE